MFKKKIGKFGRIMIANGAAVPRAIFDAVFSSAEALDEADDADSDGGELITDREIDAAGDVIAAKVKRVFVETATALRDAAGE